MLTFDAREQLIAILQLLVVYDPLYDDERQYVEVYAPKPFALPSESATLQLGGLYEATWKPWCEGKSATRSIDLLEASTLTALCAKSGAVALIIEKHLDGFAPVMGVAIEMALKALPYYYGLNDIIILNDETYIGDAEYFDAAEKYFVTAGRKLAKSYLATYGSSDYGVLARC